MLRTWLCACRPAIVALAGLTLLTGLVYPLAVTALAQLLFPHQAGGSLIVVQEHVRGSQLLGQAFTDPGHFWSRPSATAPFPYNAAASGGSNLAPSNPALAAAVAARVQALRDADPGNPRPIPVDLVTASASGLDPHISPAAADYQVERVARARGLAPQQLQALVAAHTEPRVLGVLGEARVNVLALNLALDGLQP
ncbi:K+-transporting ATPase ATPase C chain [Plasticicumulans lactativorans]|uniref:Potassium-transporting ATPase KdpC subunit n=1 Tax=Plasticicumulans lactativorans TaxID=1133106 RepID=A0A4R2LP12_9GAMM|nr:potassium-transporting ATPase subunit KdpC [Plasticicumulans lactativorans]TCO81208.1 K+-transporting ATPase ATPase C chain [Plasticicumulans lactativorans]